MSGLPPTLFTARLPGIARPLTTSEGDTLSKYLELLIKWQKTHRLVGSVEPAWIIENVFIHSLCFLEALPPEVKQLADLGSGAGLPGIPMAIVKPELRITLIEARQRRVSFLSTAIRELGLRHVDVLGERAEHLGPAYHGRFDAVVMRCAGETSGILELASRLVRDAGTVVVSAHPSAPLHALAEEIVVRAPSGVLRTFHRYTKA